ncbi:MAG TPA: histidine phosphatase family protein [Candidatus Acidoferrum sp.]|nr:histidine phosphatase family protein [Candidatus Acidoferrum sp.]
MSTLYLVRHAQASFLAEDYDKLSSLGESQATLLGEYWSNRKMLFDRACVGPCVRHRDTAKFVRDAYAKAGLAFPEPQTVPEFDEYEGENVLHRSLPELLETDQHIRDLQFAFQSAPDRAAQRATFQKLFEAVIYRWVRGEISPAGVEPWNAFRSRVNSGLSKFLASGSSGEQVAVFSSGGPIAVAMQRALDLSSEKTLQVSWMPRNCSWSEFLYSANRFSVNSFNVHAHLDDPAMLTHR